MFVGLYESGEFTQRMKGFLVGASMNERKDYPSAYTIYDCRYI